MTFTTIEIVASGFGLAALALLALGRTATCFGDLDEALVAAEVAAAGLLGTALRFFTLGAPASISRNLHKSITTGVVCTCCLLRTTQ